MMPAFALLDTNIVSHLMRGDRLAQLYQPRIQNRLLAVSFITVGELYYGAEKADWGARRRSKLEAKLREFFVVPYDEETALSYGRLVAERQKSGMPIATNDAWIAACAVRHDIPLITHNSRHFDNISGLKVITEKDPSQLEHRNSADN